MMEKKPFVNVTRGDMINRKFKFIEPTRSYRELTILTEVEQNPRTSQRIIARRALVSPTVVTH